MTYYQISCHLVFHVLLQFRGISSSYTFCSKNLTHKTTTLIKSSTLLFAIVFEMSLTINSCDGKYRYLKAIIIQFHHLLDHHEWWIFVKTIIKSNPKSFSPLSQCSTSIESLKYEVELIIKILCNMFLESNFNLFVSEWFFI